MKSIVGVFAVAAALAVSEGSAHAVWNGFGDPLNVKAPALTSYGLNVDLYARKSDGTIWSRNVQGVVGIPWNSKGAPPGGASSGPSVVRRNNFEFIVVRGNDGAIWATYSGLPWANTFGAPPTGAQTAPGIAIVGIAPYQEVQVVVMDYNQTLWRNRLPAGIAAVPVGWEQISGPVAFSVPAIAVEYNYTPHVFALASNAYTRRETCMYGSCWNNWQDFGFGVGSSGLAASAELNNFTLVSRFSVVVLSPAGYPHISVSTDSGVSFSAFQSLGGAKPDSAPAVVYHSYPPQDMVAVHRPDGNYWVNSAPGAAWESRGQP